MINFQQLLFSIQQNLPSGIFENLKVSYPVHKSVVNLSTMGEGVKNPKKSFENFKVTFKIENHLRVKISKKRNLTNRKLIASYSQGTVLIWPELWKIILNTFALKYESKIISLRKCKITRKNCFEIELKRLRDKKILQCVLHKY